MYRFQGVVHTNNKQLFIIVHLQMQQQVKKGTTSVHLFLASGNLYKPLFRVLGHQQGCMIDEESIIRKYSKLVR